MIHATRRAVLLLTAGLVIAVLPAVIDDSIWVGWAAFVLLAIAAFLSDVVLTPGAARFETAVEAPQSFGIGTQARLAIAVVGPLQRPFEVEILVDLDDELVPVPSATRTMESGRIDVAFPLCARRRGLHAIQALWLRWCGPLGLAERSHRIPLDLQVAVTPDVARVRAAALRFFQHQNLMPGTGKMELVGGGSEFDSLIEFQRGHDHRAIDWNASARLRKLLVRDLKPETNHQVMMAFDTGHLMREPIDGVPRLDHAIEAGSLLSYACLRAGDKIGLFAFDSVVRHVVEARTGMGWMGHLLEQTSNLEYGTAETNFTLGMSELSARLKRRSLIVVFTDFVDTVTAELMVENLARLSRRHLVVFVAFRDAFSEQMVEAPAESMLDVERAIISHDLLQERTAVIARLKSLGIHVLHVRPDQVSADLLNKYLEIHRRELL